MLWLFNTEPITNFYQVFFSNKQVYSDDDNIIYDFNYSSESEIFNVNTDNFKNLKLKFKIKMFDDLISYTDMLNDKTHVFSNQFKFINPIDNYLKLPVFQYSYKKVNINKMPNLIESNYNLALELDFIIYEINKNLQFIVEINTINNTVKKYFITNDLNLINNFTTGNTFI